MTMKKIIALMFVLSLVLVSSVLAASVSINPNPAYDKDDLTCAVNGKATGYEFIWKTNTGANLGSSNPLSNSRTTAGQNIICEAYAPSPFGSQYVGSASVNIQADAVTPPDNPPGENHDPTVSITNPTNYARFYAGDNINFISSGSDQDRDSITYKWTFARFVGINQGWSIVGTSTDSSVVKSFSQDGTYLAKVVVTDSHGATAETSLKVVVSYKPNTPPTTDITFPANDAQFYTGTDISFITNSYEPDFGDSLRYRWNFGDGSISNQISPIHRYTTPGDYTVYVSVTDNHWATASSSVKIKIITQNHNPVIQSITPTDGSTFNNGDSIPFSAVVSDADSGQVLSYRWDFGDGSTANSLTSNHAYTKDGDYIIEFKVDDGNGGVASKNILLHIVTPVKPNTPPKIKITQPNEGASFIEGAAISFIADVHDDENDPLMYQWIFGDGRSTLDKSPTHAYINAGNYNIQLIVSDGKDKASANVNIAVTKEIKDYAVISLQAFSDEYSTLKNAFYRGDSVYVKFSITDRGKNKGLSGLYPEVVMNAKNGATTGYLDRFSGFADGTLIWNGEPILGNGNYYYKLNSIPTTKDFLGRNTINVKFNTAGVSGSAEKDIEAFNRPIILNDLPDVNLRPDGSVVQLYIGNYVSDWETPKADIKWAVSGNRNIQVSVDTNMGIASFSSWTANSAETITFIVDDGDGGIASKTLTARVSAGSVLPNTAVTAVISGGDKNVFVGDSVSFDGSSSTGPIVSYNWAFGDGNLTSGAALTTTTYTYNTIGDYTTTLTVYNSAGSGSSASITVHVTARPPADVTANIAGGDKNANINEVLNFDGSASSGPITTYYWNFGDGLEVWGPTFSTLFHAYNTAGNYTTTLTVYNSAGANSTFSILVHVVNNTVTPPNPNNETDNGNKGNDISEDRQRQYAYLHGKEHDFEFGKISLLNYKPSYKSGDSVRLIMNLRNTGQFDEKLRLSLYIPGLSYPKDFGTITLNENENKYIDTSIVLPKGLKTGYQVIKALASNEEGDVQKTGYLSLVVTP